MDQVNSLKTETRFKKTEIGEIPVDWEITKMGELIDDIYYGITAKAIDNPVSLRILRTTDIKSYSVDWDNLPYCEITEKRRDLDRYKLKEGDFIIARAGTTGVSILVEKEIDNVIFGSYLIKIRFKNTVFKEYLKYFFQSEYYWSHIQSRQAGSALKNINLPILRSVQIVLPSFYEQNKIARILSTVDEAVEKKKEIIKKTKELKKGLMQQLLTRGIGHKKFKKTELGEIPEEWELVKVNDVCNRPEYGFTASATEEPIGPKFLRITDIQNGNVDWDRVPYCHCPDPLIDEYLLKKGDILFARTGATTGKSFLIRECPKAVFASYLIRITTREKIMPDFLYQVFNSFIYWKQINQQIGGSAQGGVNASSLSNLKIPLPSVLEQRKIVDILSSSYEEITDLVLSLKNYKKLKKGLMQVLLTGKLRTTSAG